MDMYTRDRTMLQMGHRYLFTIPMETNIWEASLDLTHFDPNLNTRRRFFSLDVVFIMRNGKSSPLFHRNIFRPLHYRYVSIYHLTDDCIHRERDMYILDNKEPLPQFHDIPPRFLYTFIRLEGKPESHLDRASPLHIYRGREEVLQKLKLRTLEMYKNMKEVG